VHVRLGSRSAFGKHLERQTLVSGLNGLDPGRVPRAAHLRLGERGTRALASSGCDTEPDLNLGRTALDSRVAQACEQLKYLRPRERILPGLLSVCPKGIQEFALGGGALVFRGPEFLIAR